MHLQETIKSIDFSQNSYFTMAIFFIFMITLLVSYFELRFYQRTVKRLEKTPKLWDDALVWAMHKPLQLLIWLFSLSWVGQLISLKTPYPDLWSWLIDARNALIILLFTWFLLRITSRLETRYLKKVDLNGAMVDHTTAQAIAQIIRVAILVTGILVILKFFFNMPLTGLWASGVAGSFVIGWAAKDLLANFFGAIMIFLDRPFSLGDWIRSPDKQIEGTVEYIGWRLTRVRTFEKRPIYIPNSVFASITVENVSRMSCWRIRETVGLRYQDSDKVDVITQQIKSMLMEHPHIDNHLTCVVQFTQFNASSLEILVYCFTDTKVWASFMAIRQEILLSIATIIRQNGAAMAFPTRTLDIPKTNAGVEAGIQL